MSSLSPKPIIAHTVRTWRVEPGMVFALVEDVERRVWIVQSCPVGTHFWTVAQAAQLPSGSQTRHTLHEAVREGIQLEKAHRRIEALPNVQSEDLTEAKPSASTNARRRMPVDKGRSRQPKSPAVRSGAKSKTLVGV